MTSLSVSIQMKATEQYFPVVLFIMLHTVVLVIMKVKCLNFNFVADCNFNIHVIKKL